MTYINSNKNKLNSKKKKKGFLSQCLRNMRMHNDGQKVREIKKINVIRSNSNLICTIKLPTRY